MTSRAVKIAGVRGVSTVEVSREVKRVRSHSGGRSYQDGRRSLHVKNVVINTLVGM